MNLRNRFVAVRLGPLAIFERRESEYEERFPMANWNPECVYNESNSRAYTLIKPIIR
jgi:hypothetical protein